MAAPERDPLRDLVAVMDRLRSPGGCPWDAEQTHQSLVQYLVEESYEAIEAIDAGDDVALREELGDLLLQVVFHARIAAESEPGFDIDDVAGDIVDKLVRRHPHVFAGEEADSAAQVEATWFARKLAEKERTSVTDGVPLGMPALLLAAKLRRRAEHGDVSARFASDAGLAAAAAALESAGDDEAAFGDLLLALVSVGEARGWDAETAARVAARNYRARLLSAEAAEAAGAGATSPTGR